MDPQIKNIALDNLFESRYTELQSPGRKNECTKPCLPNSSEASSNPAFNMRKFEFCCSKMRFMEFCNNTTHDSYGVLKVCNLDDILDKIADKMDDVRQIEHG